MTDASGIGFFARPHGVFKRVRINSAWQPGTTPLRVSGLRRGTTYRLRVDLPKHRSYETLFEAGRGPGRRTIELLPE